MDPQEPHKDRNEHRTSKFSPQDKKKLEKFLSSLCESKGKDLMFVERYSHVMHLVSSLEGTLKPELEAIDAFRACFPAGTLSGAPSWTSPTESSASIPG